MRPDIAAKLPDGRLLYRLKRRWRDGTTHMIFEPLELVSEYPGQVVEGNEESGAGGWL